MFGKCPREARMTQISRRIGDLRNRHSAGNQLGRGPIEPALRQSLGNRTIEQLPEATSELRPVQPAGFRNGSQSELIREVGCNQAACFHQTTCVLNRENIVSNGYETTGKQL